MIASLPWYDRAETQAANDRLWAGIRKQLGIGPENLTRNSDLDADWRSPDLLLSQTCGLTYPLGLKDFVTLVAAPVNDLPDCPPGQYYSLVVCRKDDPRQAFADFDGARFAYNSTDSQSGYGIALTEAARAGIRLRHGPATGAHQSSARAVASGAADLAVIDAVSWKLMERWDNFAPSLRVLTRTAASPAPPYITARGRDPEPIARALAAAIAALSPQDRDTLCLLGTVPADPELYAAMPLPPQPAEA